MVVVAVSYFDLPEHGLRFVPFDDPRFAGYLNEILEQPQPFPVPDLDALRNAAILLNENQKWVVVIEVVWRFAGEGDRRPTSRVSNFGSSEQLEVLVGGRQAGDPGHRGIAPGSKRLDAERGLFGSNPAAATAMGGRRGGGVAYAIDPRRASGVSLSEVALDVAIFDDGLCVGPDTNGMFASLTTAIGTVRETANKAVALLQGGASEGEVFDLLLPLARSEVSSRTRSGGNILLPMFSRVAVHHLIQNSREEQVAWFARFGEGTSIALHRPTITTGL